MLLLWVDFRKIISTPEFFAEDTIVYLKRRSEALYSEIEVDEKLSFTFVAALVVGRFLATVCEIWRTDLEPVTASRAQRLLEIHHTHASIFTANQANVARSVLSTKHLFEQDVSSLSRHDQLLASRERFLAWQTLALDRLWHSGNERG